MSDLHTIDSCYHKQCSINFLTEKLITGQFTDNLPIHSGRSEDSVHPEIFLQIAKYTEENDEQITIKGLLIKCENYC